MNVNVIVNMNLDRVFLRAIELLLQLAASLDRDGEGPDQSEASIDPLWTNHSPPDADLAPVLAAELPPPLELADPLEVAVRHVQVAHVRVVRSHVEPAENISRSDEKYFPSPLTCSIFYVCAHS